MRDNLIKKFFNFSYGSWIGLLLGLLTTMLTTRLLSPDAYGIMSMFDLFLQIGLIISIFGTDQSFVRFFYEEEPSKRGALLLNSIRLPFIVSVLIVGLLFIFNKHLTIFLVGEEDYKLVIWLSLGIFAQLFFRYAQLVIRMQQNGHMYSILLILQRAFNILFVLLFFYTIGARYEVLIFSKVITLILLVLIAVYNGKSFWSISNIKIKGVKHSQSEIIRFGAPFVLTIFITWLFESFDKIALRQWSDFNEIGIYSAAMRLVALVLVVKQTFSSFWVPVAYERFEKNPEDKKFFRDVSTIVAYSMFLIATVSIAGKDIFVLLLGSEYKEAAFIMPLLVFIPVLYTISETTIIGINFYKKTKWHIVIALISCVSNIIGNLLLVPNYGAFGASLSTAISYIIFFSLRTYISKKFYNVSYPLFRIYLMIIVLFFYAISSVFITNNLVNIVLSIVLICALNLLFYRDLSIIIKKLKSLKKEFKVLKW